MADYLSTHSGNQIDSGVTQVLSLTNWETLATITIAGPILTVNSIDFVDKQYIDGLAYIPNASALVRGLVKISTDFTMTGDTISIASGWLTTAKVMAVVPAASTLVQGKIQIATDSDVIIGTNTAKAVTPAQLKNNKTTVNTFAGDITISAGDNVTVSDDTNTITIGTTGLVADAAADSKAYVRYNNAWQSLSRSNTGISFTLTGTNVTGTGYSVVWTGTTATITHSLNDYVSVDIFDAAGNVCFYPVQIVDATHFKIEFPAADAPAAGNVFRLVVIRSGLTTVNY